MHVYLHLSSCVCVCVCVCIFISFICSLSSASASSFPLSASFHPPLHRRFCYMLLFIHFCICISCICNSASIHQPVHLVFCIFISSASSFPLCLHLFIHLWIFSSCASSFALCLRLFIRFCIFVSSASSFPMHLHFLCICSSSSTSASSFPCHQSLFWLCLSLSCSTSACLPLPLQLSPSICSASVLPCPCGQCTQMLVCGVEWLIAEGGAGDEKDRRGGRRRVLYLHWRNDCTVLQFSLSSVC